MFSDDIQRLSAEVLDAARRRNLLIAAAESCTGGLVAAALTEIAGSSDVFDRGFVTYSNAAKQALLGVPEASLSRHGAVSGPVARAMAEGALQASGAGVAVAVTGIAGPGGGSPEKPVGLVWLAVARRSAETVLREERFGELGRDGVRIASVRSALEMLKGALEA
jgi:nicotinamide-nucleotide amidase